MTAAATKGRLHGLHVLILEDEFFIADDLDRAVTRSGADVVGPFSDCKKALKHIEHGPIDVAVLDINLAGQQAFEVADALAQRAVPFLFATGYDRSIIPQRHLGVPRWQKPFDSEALAAALLSLVGAGSVTSRE
ncbi:MAG: response regulator [Pararhizobium sp.]